jgi:hypothetical protein
VPATSSRTGCSALPHKFLVLEGAVDLSGVEHRDAPVDRGAEEGDHLLSWRSWTEGLAHAPAVQAEGGQSLRAEGACLACGFP